MRATAIALTVAVLGLVGIVGVLLGLDARRERK